MRLEGQAPTWRLLFFCIPCLGNARHLITIASAPPGWFKIPRLRRSPRRQLREGKAPPAPKPNNTRFNQTGSVGASTLPHVIKQRTAQPRCDGLLKRRSSRKAFQLREGKAPPAPQLTKTRFNQTSSNVQPTNRRINPNGSDGASTLPNKKTTN